MYTIEQSSTIREALVAIKSNAIGMVFILGNNEAVIGVATDGDIRSSLINRVDLSDSISKAFNSDFVWRHINDSRESILKLLDTRIKAIPILDDDMRLVDVVTTAQFPLVIEENVFARSKAPVRVSLPEEVRI